MKAKVARIGLVALVIGLAAMLTTVGGVAASAHRKRLRRASR